MLVLEAPCLCHPVVECSSRITRQRPKFTVVLESTFMTKEHLSTSVAQVRTFRWIVTWRTAGVVVSLLSILPPCPCRQVVE